MRKTVHYLLMGVVAVIGLLAVTALLLFEAAQREPEFYQEALLIELDHQEEEGESLEQNVLELHNDVRKSGTWEATFTEEQVNGWLAADMPTKFPNVLPKGTQEPRVKIDSDVIRVACRFDNGKIETVISFALDLDLTTETNTLAIRIRKLRAGMLPVPLKQFLDKITSAGSRADVSLRWSQVDGDPVALVTVPTTHEDYAHREIYIDALKLQEGQVYLAGHTEQHTSDRLNTAAATQRDVNSTLQR